MCFVLLKNKIICADKTKTTFTSTSTLASDPICIFVKASLKLDSKRKRSQPGSWCTCCSSCQAYHPEWSWVKQGLIFVSFFPQQALIIGLSLGTEPTFATVTVKKSTWLVVLQNLASVHSVNKANVVSQSPGSSPTLDDEIINSLPMSCSIVINYQIFFIL